MDIVTLALAKKYADEKLTNVKVDLTGYAKEDYVDAEIEELNKKIVQETGKLSKEKVDQKELENYALKDEIPTVPVQSVNGKTGAVQLSASEVGALPNSTKIPTKTSDLTNDSGFITNLVNNLANYYLKSETYTQEEINQKLSIIPKFSIKVVSSLPTSDINDTTVYLVKSGEDENNLYTEYIYVDGAWELLGKQSVDLSDYALTSDIPTALSELTNDAGFITKYVSDLENYYVKNDVYNKDEIDAKGYLTEHQDISGLAPKATTLAGYGITDGVTNEQIEQFSGTVEITSDAPTKEQTVLTINPESETVNLYTAEEVDEKFNQLSEEIGDLKENSSATIEAPKIVSSVEEMTDTTKHYVNQTTGTIWAYMKHEKSTEGSTVANFTNVFDVDKALIEYRWSGSSGAPVRDQLLCTLSDFIPCDLSSGEHIIRVKGAFMHSASNRNTSIVYFSSADNSTQIKMVKYSELTAIEEDGGVFAYKLGDCSGDMFSNYQNTRYIRVCFRLNGDETPTTDNVKNVIMTIDEPITYTNIPASTETYYEWTNAGIAYAPTFKTDLVGVLGEGNVVYLSDNLPSGTYTLKYPDNDYATIGTITK